MELIVVRHAIAYERDDSRWPGDRDRPLTSEGEKRFRRAASGLGAIVGEVDRVLSSPLARAWRTAELLAEVAGWPEPEPEDALEPDRAAPDVADALRPLRSLSVVAIVGHEPLLGDVIGYLLTGSKDDGAFGLKKGGAACLTLEEPGPDEAALKWMLTPKIERSLAT